MEKRVLARLRRLFLDICAWSDSELISSLELELEPPIRA
jgi:hypothetical protein